METFYFGCHFNQKKFCLDGFLKFAPWAEIWGIPENFDMVVYTSISVVVRGSSNFLQALQYIQKVTNLNVRWEEKG